MKTSFFPLLAILTFVGLTAFDASAQSRKRTITLRHVVPGWQVVEGNPAFDFIHEEEIFYTKVDKKREDNKYDNLFRETAIVYALSLQVKETQRRLKSGEIDPESDYAKSLHLIKEQLNGLPNRVRGLTSSLETLQPSTDFPGIKGKAQAAFAVKGVAKALKQLNTVRKDLPAVLSDFDTVMEMIETNKGQ